MDPTGIGRQRLVITHISVPGGAGSSGYGPSRPEVHDAVDVVRARKDGAKTGADSGPRATHVSIRPRTDRSARRYTALRDRHVCM